MSQQSGQRSPRQDDQLSHETQGMEKAGHRTRAEEFRDPEPEGEDQPEVLGGTGVEVKEDPDAALRARDVDRRSELGRWVNASAFPGDRQALLASAQENHAPDHVLDELQSLPDGRTWENVQEIAVELGIVPPDSPEQR